MPTVAWRLSLSSPLSSKCDSRMKIKDKLPQRKKRILYLWRLRQKVEKEAKMPTLTKEASKLFDFYVKKKKKEEKLEIKNRLVEEREFWFFVLYAIQKKSPRKYFSCLCNAQCTPMILDSICPCHVIQELSVDQCAHRLIFTGRVAILCKLMWKLLCYQWGSPNTNISRWDLRYFEFLWVWILSILIAP